MPRISEASRSRSPTRTASRSPGTAQARPRELHQRIYAAATPFDSETACIFHSHSTHCVRLTLEPAGEELLRPITPYFVMKVGHVPVVPYDRPGAPAVADAVSAAIRRYGERGTPLRAVMLERLGPVVWHDSPGSAMAVLEELEETARLTVSTAAPAALDEAQIDKLRRTFNARW